MITEKSSLPNETTAKKHPEKKVREAIASAPEVEVNAVEASTAAVLEAEVDVAEAEPALQEAMERDTLEEIVPEPFEPPPLPPSSKTPSSRPEPISVTSTLPARQWPPRLVSDLMTRKIITLREDDPIGDIQACMEKFRFHHLPVVDGQMKLVGLITRTDFMRAVIESRQDGARAEKVDTNTRASVIMRKILVTAKPSYSLLDVVRVMLSEKLGCIPVVLDDATLVGIVTESDFARLALELLVRQTN